jgi:xanthine dehydrogenase accessory factor
MLVRSDGKLVGTIGGGCGEAGVIQKAHLSLTDGQFREELADLTEDISVESEGVCGGTLRVFIEPWQPQPEAIALADELARLGDGSAGLIVHQVIQGEPAPAGPLGRRAILDEAGRPLYSGLPAGFSLPTLPPRRLHQVSHQGTHEVYSERWEPIPTLVVVGAGHIAEPLEQVGRLVGFRTVVVDDRRLFANRERFPQAGQVVCGPILEVMRQIELTPHHYLVLVTRGHTLDMDALRVLIDRSEPLAYIGMIGSKRRVGAVLQLLEREGYPRELFTHVYTPVGLSIGAETPAEIAVSIAAEMISVLRKAGEDTRSMARLTGLHPALRRASLPGDG